MLGSKNNKKHILNITVGMLIVALVFSAIPSVFAQTEAATEVIASEANAEETTASVESSEVTENEAVAISETDETENSTATGNGIQIGTFLEKMAQTTGINSFINGKETVDGLVANTTTDVMGWQRLVMLLIGFIIVYLGAGCGFEPLLLIPIGFGTILVNIPGAGMWQGEHGPGMLKILYDAGVGNEFFPMLIFMGIGAMTDFGPLIANPKTAILGGAAQFGVFATLIGVALLNFIPGFEGYSLREACAIAIIGGADGPTSIYVAGNMAPDLMAVIAVAAYSYMALVPVIQPPIMKLLTTKKERMIKMKQLRPVSKAEKTLFPLVLLGLAILLLPPAAPLIGMLAIGNFCKQCGVVDRLSKTMENELLNIVSILLSLGVGSQMTPEKIMRGQSLGIILMGLFAFAIATATGLLMAKLMNLFLKEKINPLIGSAGVSAVPMAARVSNKVGQEADPSNFLLMHAMGPNVAGVIGTAVAAGVFIAAKQFL